MRSKHGVKAFVLAMMAAALGTMAFGAVGAQAQLEPPAGVLNPPANTAGAILINGSDALLATVTGRQLGLWGVLLVPGRSIEIKCKEGHVIEGKITDKTDGFAKFQYLGCGTYTHPGEVLIGNCILKGGGTTLTTQKVLIKPILHNGVSYVLAEPAEGVNFITVSYEANKGCTLPLNNPVTGAAVAQVDLVTGSANPLLLLSHTIQLLSGDKLLFGAFESFVDAEAEAELTGEHVGDKLEVH